MNKQNQVRLILITFLIMGCAVGLTMAAVPQSTIRTTGGITSYVGHFVNATQGYYVGTTEIIDNTRAASLTSVTGTSFIIGADTLDTNEWGYLDGLDQSVSTSDNVNFTSVEADEFYLSSVNITDRLNGYWVIDFGIYQDTPLAPLHVGSRNTENSVDSQILISRDVTGTGNGHAFSDSSLVDRTGNIGYNSYDSRIEITGSENYDHYAGFQFAPTYDSSGTISQLNAFVSVPIVSDGTVTDASALRIYNPINSATITNNYGVYCADLTAGGSNYPIYIDTQTSGIAAVFQSSVGIGTTTPTDAALEIETPRGTSTKFRMRQLTENYWDWIIPSNQSYLTLNDVGGELVRFDFISNGGYVEFKGTDGIETNRHSRNNQATTLGVGETTFAATHGFITLTGDGGANTIGTITGGVTGEIITILFVDGQVTITDTDAHTANTVDLSAAFTSADDTVLTLLYDGTSWYEISRSVN